MMLMCSISQKKTPHNGVSGAKNLTKTQQQSVRALNADGVMCWWPLCKQVPLWLSVFVSENHGFSTDFTVHVANSSAKSMELWIKIFHSKHLHPYSVGSIFIRTCPSFGLPLSIYTLASGRNQHLEERWQMQSWSRLTSLPVFLGRKKMEQSGKLIVSRYVRFQDFPADLDIAQFLLYVAWFHARSNSKPRHIRAWLPSAWHSALRGAKFPSDSKPDFYDFCFFTCCFRINPKRGQTHRDNFRQSWPGFKWINWLPFQQRLPRRCQVVEQP